MTTLCSIRTTGRGVRALGALLWLAATLPGCAHGPCEGSCEVNDWPRAILALSGPGLDGATVSATDAEGNPLELYAGGCPELPSSLICSYSVLATRESPVNVVVTSSDGRQARTLVELAAYNSCGRNIAYQEVAVAEDAVTFSDTRYVSPCDMEGLE